MYLNCKTNYSFRYGTFFTEELVKAAAEMELGAIALTNINNTCDSWDFVLHCRTHGIKPILGAEIRNGQRLLYILLAANSRGFAEINQFLSKHLLAETNFPEPTELKVFEKAGDGFVVYPLNTKKPELLAVNEMIGLLPSDLKKIFRIDLKLLKSKFVIRQPVTFRNKIYYNVHRLLRAIDNNVLLSKLEKEQVCGIDEYFVPPHELLEKFKQFPEIVTNTYRLMDSCSVEMDFSIDKNKKVFSATREDDRILLSKLSRDGLQMRYGKKNREAAKRLERELEIINDLGFNAYFLITWDIIRYAQSKGYFHVGRGSGANSIVAYCLQITDVDPMELNLYFERFLNPHRASPPDFDIDFSWTDRDDVIDYVFKRYGKEHVALLGMHPTFQYNAIIRELGKVFGLPKAEMDELAEKGYYNGPTRSENFMKKPNEDKLRRIILQYGKLIQDFPNMLSIHAGGILISEEPISTYTPVYMPPKGFPTTHIDMYVSEDIGLHKLDILSQRGLGHIRDCLTLIKKNKGIDVNIHEVEKFKKDEKIKENIKNGKTIGCFYIESPAMRHVLKKLNCQDYLTLVAASSIIRPGVGRSGMMREFIFRHNNPGGYEYIHPKIGEILKETYGVMVYQEDVIKVAHIWAELDMGEADLLRRATSFKNRAREKIGVLKEKFFANGERLNYPKDVVAEVWRQIDSFGAFSFCKAHSASFAVESYQSLFLKTYFPVEFMVAVINNFGGYYSRELYFYELMKTGADIHAPCVNNSEYLTDIKGDKIFVGFIHVKSLEQALVEKIIEERRRNGPYLYLHDFIERTDVTKEQLNILVRIGALRFTGQNKKQLLWAGDFLLKHHKAHVPASKSLFVEAEKKFNLPALPIYPLDDIYDEVELLGFPICPPFKLVDDDPDKYLPASRLQENVGNTITVLGYHITHKPVRTIRGETMSFGTFIDSNMDWVDSVHFPEIHKRVAPQAGFYRITGKVIQEFGVYSIEVTDIEKAGIKKRREGDS